jgi:NAD+ diphosphatase
VAGEAEPVLLGLDAAGPVFAADLAEAPAPEGAAVRGLRDVATRLGAADAGLLAHAAALLHWRRTARFCGRCGAATVAGEGGLLRACPACGLHLHPRTDPVVIMLVRDGDRALLGRRPGWPAGRFSALAGFVEPGESLEEAVAREVGEEAGVAVRDVAYRSSQPWPFPGSLMLGFEAAWAGGEPVAADGELEAVRWFTAEELDAARRGEGAYHLPGPEAIARRLVDGWLGAARP